MTSPQEARRAEMDRSNWRAVLEALDEVDSRIPEGHPMAAGAARYVHAVRRVAADAIASDRETTP